MITFILGLVSIPVAMLIGTIMVYQPSNINKGAENCGFGAGRRKAWSFRLD